MTVPANSERGATLLEVLVALAITAMIAAAVTRMTGFGLTVVERGETASQSSARAYLDERRLRDALTGLDGGEGGFIGDSAGFQWRGPGPDGVAAASVATAEAQSWRLDREGRLAPCPGNRCETAVKWLEAPLTGFAYAGSDGVFVEEWRGGPPPHLIRITTGAETGEIIIAPRIRGAE